MNLNGRIQRLEAEALTGEPCDVCGAGTSTGRNFLVYEPETQPRPPQHCASCGRENVIIKILYGVSMNDL